MDSSQVISTHNPNLQSLNQKNNLDIARVIKKYRISGSFSITNLFVFIKSSIIVLNIEDLRNSHLQIWSFLSGKMLHVSKHQRGIMFLSEIGNNKIIYTTGYPHFNLAIWDIFKRKAQFFCSDHQNRITCAFQLYPDIIISASIDKTIKFWNIMDGTCFNTISNKDQQECLSIAKISLDIIACTSGCDINIYKIHFIIRDPKQFVAQPASILIGDCELITNICSIGGNERLLSVSESSCKIWNWIEGTCLINLKEKIWICNILLNNYVVASNYNYSLQIWNTDGIKLQGKKLKSRITNNIYIKDQILISMDISAYGSSNLQNKDVTFRLWSLF